MGNNDLAEAGGCRASPRGGIMRRTISQFIIAAMVFAFVGVAIARAEDSKIEEKSLTEQKIDEAKVEGQKGTETKAEAKAEKKDVEMKAEKKEGKKAETKCHLEFSLSGWSIFYKTSNGEGTITCDDGQKKSVAIKTHGGGVTFGKSSIANGHGTFSKVADIKELFGSYATSEAHAGASRSAGAQAMTKGRVSLALSGTGKGYDLGFAFGSFKITPKTE
jgi:hypothetical protein